MYYLYILLLYQCIFRILIFDMLISRLFRFSVNSSSSQSNQTITSFDSSLIIYRWVKTGKFVIKSCGFSFYFKIYIGNLQFHICICICYDDFVMILIFD